MKRRLPSALVLLLLLTTVLTANEDRPLQTPPDRPADIKHIRLDLDLSIQEQTVSGEAALRFQMRHPRNELHLDAVNFDVSSVHLKRNNDQDRTAIDHRNTGEELIVSFPNRLNRGDRGTLLISYTVSEPEDGLHFFEPSDANPDVPYQVWSQGQTDGNRHWFPSIDHPAERQSTELVVTVDQSYRVLSNGKLINKSKNEDENTVTYHWHQKKPHPSYLVSLIVGSFEVIRKEWNDLPVTYYVPENRSEEGPVTFEHTKDMLTFFQERFGVPYPWNKYAQVVVEQFFYGGMENTSSTVLDDRVLHNERALRGKSPDWLIAHELAHQWFGNMITAREWAHIWLNEGWATLSETLWANHLRGKNVARYQLWNDIKTAIKAGKDRPVVDRHYRSTWEMFDQRAYAKGAVILHMLREKVGKDLFWKATRTFIKTYRFQSVETSDFRQTFEEVTGYSLERFFHDWTRRAGNPEMAADIQYQSEDDLIKVTLKQQQDQPAFHVPVEINVIPGGDETDPSTVRTTMTEKQSTVYIPARTAPEQVRIDPDQRVLTNWSVSKSKELWKRQLKSAPNPVLRIRAAEHFGETSRPEHRSLLRSALENESFYGVSVEIIKQLGEMGGEKTVKTLIHHLNNSDNPRVRKASAEALRKFPDRESVQNALRNVIQKGDKSYYVTEEALASYGEINPDDAPDVLKSKLDQDSYRDHIRKAAIAGLARTGRPEAVPLLLDLLKPETRAEIQTDLLRSIGSLIDETNLSEETRKQIVSRLTEVLNREGRRVKHAAARTLRKLGSVAEPALKTLEAIAAHDPSGNVRKAAEETIERIKSGKSPNLQLKELRSEIKTLREQQKTLKKRLQKQEARPENEEQ